MPATYLTPRELGELLGVSEHTLRTWRRKRIGPRWRRAGARLVRYARSDVDAWLARPTGASDDVSAPC